VPCALAFGSVPMGDGREARPAPVASPSEPIRRFPSDGESDPAESDGNPVRPLRTGRFGPLRPRANEPTMVFDPRPHHVRAGRPVQRGLTGKSSGSEGSDCHSLESAVRINRWLGRTSQRSICLFAGWRARSQSSTRRPRGRLERRDRAVCRKNAAVCQAFFTTETRGLHGVTRRSRG
jgi:hypothetical protein